MKSIAVSALLLALGSATTGAFAGPTCTAPKEQWKPQDAFQQDLKNQGYQIRTFKVTKGNCYEIYGTDKTGKKVEIYFDPATGAVLKSE